MAFPEDTKTFLKAINPTWALDITDIAHYQELLKNGNFTEAAEYLANPQKFSGDGPAMNINAARFNEVLEEIIAIENFYQGNNGPKAYIQNRIDAASDIAVFQSGTPYVVGNVVAASSAGGQYYQCIKNTIAPHTQPLTDTEYWAIFLQPQPAKQYPISATQPVGQAIGDLWFEVLND